MFKIAVTVNNYILFCLVINTSPYISDKLKFTFEFIIKSLTEDVTIELTILSIFLFSFCLRCEFLPFLKATYPTVRL